MDAGGDPQVSLYYAIAGQRVAMRNADGLQYLLTDHLGSISAVLDDTGALMENSEQRYMPFGEERLLADEQTDFGYTGQRDLAAVGLMDYNARWYGPASDRFSQPDTLIPGFGNPQNLNRYSYAVNNPVRFIDPSGHTYCDSFLSCEDDYLYTRPAPPPGSGGNSSGGNSSGGDGSGGNNSGGGNSGAGGPSSLDDDLNNTQTGCGVLAGVCDAYATRQSNYEMALLILKLQQASAIQKLYAGGYLAVDIGAHVALVTGVGLLGCGFVPACYSVAIPLLGVTPTVTQLTNMATHNPLASTAIIGSYSGSPNYIDIGISRAMTYFDIPTTIRNVTETLRTAANVQFINNVVARGQSVQYLIGPQGVGPGLQMEFNILTMLNYPYTPLH